MQQDFNPADLVDRVPDERLAEEIVNLPAALGRPEAPAPSRTRGRLVGLGATLTGLTLIAGCLLIVVGLIDAVATGLGLPAVGAIALGFLLVATHWGWVHVAEATADAIDSRQAGEVLARRRQWLASIRPYPRYEVTTSVAEDGSISIVRTRFRPVPSGDRGFTFVREPDDVEVHSGDEAAATVAERAELLRRAAAVDTERERARFEVAADAYETALLHHEGEQQRVAARRAAADALSERINANLRDPPLIE
jgi:hypothetical protein